MNLATALSLPGSQNLVLFNVEHVFNGFRYFQQSYQTLFVLLYSLAVAFNCVRNEMKYARYAKKRRWNPECVTIFPPWKKEWVYNWINEKIFKYNYE